MEEKNTYTFDEMLALVCSIHREINKLKSEADEEYTSELITDKTYDGKREGLNSAQNAVWEMFDAMVYSKLHKKEEN